MSVHAFPRASDGVYALFCEPIDGWTYVKIGNSSSVVSRLAALTTGCPFEFGRVLWAKVPSFELAYRVEAAIHRKLRPHRTAREWFRFRLDNPEHKEAFHTATRMAFAEVLGVSPTVKIAWHDIDIETIRGAYNKRGRKGPKKTRQPKPAAPSYSDEDLRRRTDALKGMGVFET